MFTLLDPSEGECRCGAPLMLVEWSKNDADVYCANRADICEYGKPRASGAGKAEALAKWREMEKTE